MTGASRILSRSKTPRACCKVNEYQSVSWFTSVSLASQLDSFSYYTGHLLGFQLFLRYFSKVSSFGSVMIDISTRNVIISCYKFASG